MHFKLFYFCVLFFTSFQFAKSVDYINDYSDKPNGVYFLIGNYYCTSCLASFVNDVGIKLKELNIQHKIIFYSKNEFNYEKYKRFFNDSSTFIKVDPTQKFPTVYIIKNDGYLYIADLNQLLDSRNIVEKAKSIISTEEKNTEIGETIFSIRNLTQINDTISYFSDEFTSNIYRYNNSSNKITKVSYKIDSLKDYYLAYNKSILPRVWANGYKNYDDKYFELSKRMNYMNRINSFSVAEGDVKLLFSLITHLDEYLDSAHNLTPSLMARYTSFIYDFNSRVLWKTKFQEMFYKVYIDNLEYSFFMNKKQPGFCFAKTLDNKILEVIYRSPDYMRVYKIGKRLLLLGKDTTLIYNPKDSSISGYDIAIKQSNQLIPDRKELPNTFFTVDNYKDNIEINTYEFGDELKKHSLVLKKKSILKDKNYLGVLSVQESKNSYTVEILTEEQGVYTIKLANN